MAKRSAEEQEALDKIWVEFKQSGGLDLRNQLMEAYLPLVRYISERICAKLPKNVDVDDLQSAGVFGLMGAIEAFDLERGVKFETYCSTRVRGSILDELRSLDWVPRLVRSKAAKLLDATRELEAKLGRYPEDHEVAEHMGLSIDEYNELVREASAVTVVSLSSRWNDNDDERDTSRIDVVEDKKGADPSGRLQRQELRDIITKDLSDTEKLIIILYYYEELTMKEIGDILGLSESRVCQIHSKIIVRLSAQFIHFREEMAS